MHSPPEPPPGRRVRGNHHHRGDYLPFNFAPEGIPFGSKTKPYLISLQYCNAISYLNLFHFLIHLGLKRLEFGF